MHKKNGVHILMEAKDNLNGGKKLFNIINLQDCQRETTVKDGREWPTEVIISKI